TEQRIVLRSRIVLLAAEGLGTNDIARELSTRPGTVSKWRVRFAKTGMKGLFDAPRSGTPTHYDENTELRILSKLDEPVPHGETVWTARLLAKELGDVSNHHIWRVFRKHGIHLQRRSWCISTDPQFAEKAADIVGLYLAPPENAVVISVDEKPSIQALERTQGYLRLNDGKTYTGFSDRYKRHGTTTLFGALEVATGMVTTGHYKRRRRLEFLDFMNKVISQYPEDQEIHLQAPRQLTLPSTLSPREVRAHQVWIGSSFQYPYRTVLVHRIWGHRITPSYRSLRSGLSIYLLFQALY
ncbi:MAG: IS630 family transposase, partial [Actinomycetia bacterium]|nr:IS630 family transposase [Actinomycetes bacterium]